jgi:voltage-gated sodium channel
MDTRSSRLVAFVEHPKFQTVTTAVIVLNAITLGLETVPSLQPDYGHVLHFFDRMALAYFTVEVVLRIAAHRLGFFRSGWGWFDFIIVAISLMPQSGALSVLRSMRILRALRLFSTVPALRRVVGALVHAIPGMASIGVVLAVVFFVSAVLASKLFGATFPQWFGHLGTSLYTLFQIMTLESWSMGIVRPVLEVHPHAWIFFVPFIVVTSFAVLNLFIGVIVSAIQEVADPSKAESALETEMRGLRRDVDEILRRLPPRVE